MVNGRGEVFFGAGPLIPIAYGVRDKPDFQVIGLINDMAVWATEPSAIPIAIGLVNTRLICNRY